MKDNIAFLGIAGFIATGLIILRRESSLNIFPTSAFVDLEATQEISEALSGLSEEDYVYSAWSFVARQIKYEPVASDIVFLDGTVQCRDCFMPKSVLTSHKGNCVAKSSLLLSILRHRIPASRVNMVMGELRHNGIGGHAWIELEQEGLWYVLESTISPDVQPALEVSQVRGKYIPEVTVNDVEHTCLTDSLCISMDKRRCPCLDF